MFFIKDLTLTLTLHPSHFGPDMKTHLRHRLLQDVEGTCTGEHGYIVCVLDILNSTTTHGKVVPFDPCAHFNVQYKALVWKPIRGEVVDAQVSSVSPMGFFAHAGPLAVFISRHLMPTGFEHRPQHTPPAYVSTGGTTGGGNTVISVGVPIRVKIVGTRADVGSISAIGSIKEDYLGPL
ncbi:hypothetical protein CAS74_002180 [Pichia kudriavzevii]|uniref:DNA-directed RNA polymerase subunit n=1 Tax=Pichia kudriavzevii TaxID=4909 RepID=A0A099P242_PICKU|nr:uncharacterized protein C5L36_0D02110 [Pichia kudriavzevii]AWU77468.1 hypothetical protein C5L36_0D02110 [Pichia kudriavzevii]KGK38339.1 hypothetical protein JL09_g2499 [Pichia kudriavzevii]OUT22445.1 hypothetical protein CAS74_002180 [Pichia kudriavzevii]